MEYHLKVSLNNLREQRELSEELKEALDELLELAQKSGQNVVKIAKIGEKAGDMQIVIEAQKMLEEQKELLNKIYTEVMDNKEGIKVAVHNAGVAVDIGNKIVRHQNQWFPHIVKELSNEMGRYYELTRKFLVDIDRNTKATRDMTTSIYQDRYRM